MIARMVMAVESKSPGFKVDGRVSIALDALDDKQKLAVGGILTDRAHFLKSTSDSHKVQRISKETPLYSLKVPSGLRIIYSQVGDEIVVMDLMRQATLDRYTSKGSKAKSSRTREVRTAPDVKKAK
jgi:hypothetical protein